MYILFDTKTKQVLNVYFHFADRALLTEGRPANEKWINPRECTSLEQANKLADKVSNFTHKVWVGVDQGSNFSPRFTITQIPDVGDAVSYCFNGDSYPDGVITKISKTFQITTSGGHKYFRRKQTGTWLRTGGTWALISGHHDERNPSF